MPSYGRVKRQKSQRLLCFCVSYDGAKGQRHDKVNFLIFNLKDIALQALRKLYKIYSAAVFQKQNHM